MIPIGAITRGVKGFFDVKKLDDDLAVMAQQIVALPPVQAGMLVGLAPRQRAEAELKLLMIEADWRRRMGHVITHYEERIGALVQQVRELQLKDTPATKWDIEVLTKTMAQLGEDFRLEVAAIDQRAQAQARRVTQLTDQLSKETGRTNQLAERLEKQNGALKAILASRTKAFIAAMLVTFATAAGGLTLALLHGR